MGITEQFKEWWSKNSDSDKHKLIKEKSTEVNNLHKKMLKASESEFNFNGCRTGIRGGKRTTLAANTHTAFVFYHKSLEELKYMVSKI